MNMKRITQLIIMSICMTSCVTTTDEGLDVLKKLGTQLNQVRALPTGTPTNLRCPEKLDIFTGIKKDKIYSELGEPDSSYAPESDADEKWCYFFTSPIPSGRRGGGFPELTFYFNDKNLVERATCYYSK
jgi:hypothetical protein